MNSEEPSTALQAAADERPVPAPLVELAAGAALPLLAWRLDAAEQGAPGAPEPEALAALAERFAGQLDRLGEAAGPGRLRRVLLLLQADLLLLFSAGKLRVRARPPPRPPPKPGLWLRGVVWRC